MSVTETLRERTHPRFSYVSALGVRQIVGVPSLSCDFASCEQRVSSPMLHSPTLTRRGASPAIALSVPAGTDIGNAAENSRKS